MSLKSYLIGGISMTNKKRKREANRAACKRYYAKNKKAFREKNKELSAITIKWLDEYKNTLKCSRCDESHPACLDFHHVYGEKKFTIGEVKHRGYCVETVKAEIAKCIVLCSNCHRKLHWDETA